VNLIAELSGYVWDEKALERGEEKPLKTLERAIRGTKTKERMLEGLKWGGCTAGPGR
jgi:hypothetical protein